MEAYIEVLADRSLVVDLSKDSYSVHKCIDCPIVRLVIFVCDIGITRKVRLEISYL